MFFSSSKMASDAAATRRARNEAHDALSLSKQVAIIKRERKLLELRIIEETAQEDMVKAAKAAEIAAKAVADAQLKLASKTRPKFSEKQAIAAAWNKVSLDAEESKRLAHYQQYKGRFNIFRKTYGAHHLAEEAAASRDIFDDPQNADENENQVEVNLVALQYKADAARKAEIIKAKVARDAASDLVAANERFLLKPAVTLNKEDATAAAFEKANEAAAEAIKARQMGRFSLDEKPIDEEKPVIIESLKITGADKLAAAAAVQRNVELEEDAKSREFAALPVEKLKVMAEIARERLSLLKAQAKFADEVTKNVKENEAEKQRIDEEAAQRTLELAKEAKMKDAKAKLTRSQIAAANLERLQQKQDEADAKRLNKLSVANAFKAEKEEEVRLRELTMAQAAAAAHAMQGSKLTEVIA